MSLWVDKHRPKSLDKLDFHPEVSSHLSQLCQRGDIPHLLVYGPSGAGKKTRVACLLKQLYGPAADKLKIEHRSFKATPSKTVEISSLASIYHIEINCSDVGIDDYHVVRIVLKEIASTPQLDSSQHPFKVVVLSEADRLTRKAQQALRRLMEKYVRNCRYILICNSTSKVLAPIRSRCLAVRVSAPTLDEVCAVLGKVAKKEHVTLPDGLCRRIAESTGRNLRRALLMLEACHASARATGMSADMPLAKADWELYISQTAQLILKEQSPAKLLEIRGRFYELLSHCIPADIIVKNLVLELIKNLDVELKHEFVGLAAEYEHRLQCGSKEIFHLEAFVAKVMAMYKTYLSQFDA